MYDFIFHDVAEGVNEGKVGKVSVVTGDIVEEGDELLIVETDKVTTELTSPVDGKIHKINIKTGDDITVGQVLMEIDDSSSASTEPTKKIEGPAEDLSKAKSEIDDLLPPDEENASVVGTVTVGTTTLKRREGMDNLEKENKKIIITPIARKMAKDLNVDINDVTPTGPNGRIIIKDIKNAASNINNNLQSKPSAEIEDTQEIRIDNLVKDLENKATTLSSKNVPASASYVVPLSSVRVAIANAMVKSVYTIPHTSLNDDADITNIASFRQEYKEQWKKEDNLYLSFLPFIIKAVSIALEKYPILNARINLEKRNAIYFNNHNIGIAAATKTGLKVPVMFQVQGNGIKQIGQKLSEIIEKIKADNFSMKDLQGGTFTITNYGSIGAKYGTPVINYPESAILGIGRTETLPRYNSFGELKPRQIMGLTLVFDHRLIDGADAAKFLVYVIKLLADPALLAIY